MRQKHLISEKPIKNIENKYFSYKGILIMMHEVLETGQKKMQVEAF